MKMNLKSAAISLGLVALVSCSNPIINEAPKLAEQAVSSRDLVLPGGSAELSYLGGGRELLNNQTKFQAVTVGQGVKVIGGASTETYNFFASNKFELASSLNSEFSSGASGTLFGKLTLGAEVSNKVSASLNFSSNRVVYTAVIKYDDSRIIASPTATVLSADARQVYLNSGRAAFRSNYGDGYVSSVLLGERLYMTMVCDGSTIDSELKMNFKSAANAKFLEIVSGSASVNVDASVRTAMQQMSVSTQINATGGFIPTVYVRTADDFAAIYAAFATFVQGKVNGSNTVPFSVVATEYQSYDALLNNLADVDSFQQKIIAWNQVRATVEVVNNDSSDSGLKAQCTSAFTVIDRETALCRERSASARAPRSGEFSALENAWQAIVGNASYIVHMADLGWGQGWMNGGAMAGTTGQSRQLEALRIKLPGNAPYLWGIDYQVHAAGMGWMQVMSNGAVAGTTGQSRQIEAVRIWLRNAPQGLNVNYRVHCAGSGWTAWAQNGAMAGTTGQSRRIEAIEIRVSR